MDIITCAFAMINPATAQYEAATSYNVYSANRPLVCAALWALL